MGVGEDLEAEFCWKGEEAPGRFGHCESQGSGNVDLNLAIHFPKSCKLGFLLIMRAVLYAVFFVYYAVYATIQEPLVTVEAPIQVKTATWLQKYGKQIDQPFSGRRIQFQVLFYSII